MKTSIIVFIGVILSGTMAVAASSPMQAAPGGRGLGRGGNCPGACLAIDATSLAPLSLSVAAREALLFQIEEERMARELYAAFGERWSLRPFANIPVSEARHEAVLRQLAARAGITPPAAAAGVFANAEVQRRYHEILALGQGSAPAALRAGALVEETDIADLRAMARTTDDPTLRATIAALERASENHLRAFVRNLRMRGITYQPVVLATDDYQSIVAARGQKRGR